MGNIRRDLEIIANAIRRDANDPKERDTLFKLGRQILTRSCEPTIHNCLVPIRNFRSEIREIFRFIKNKMRPTGGPLDIDILKTLRATEVLSARGCVCLDCTLLIAVILISQGFHSIRIVAADSGNLKGEFDHVFLRVGVPPGNVQGFITVDFLAPDIDVEPPRTVEAVLDIETGRFQINRVKRVLVGGMRNG